MIARVRFFARLSDIAGLRETEVEIGEGMRVSEVFAKVADRWPKMRDLEPSLLYAVNAEYVEPDHPVRPGDELALIPPVSGGCADSRTLDPSLSEGRRPNKRYLQMNRGQIPNDRARDDSGGGWRRDV